MNRNQFYFIVFLIWFIGGFFSATISEVGALILIVPMIIILVGGFAYFLYSYYIYLGQDSNQKETS